MSLRIDRVAVAAAALVLIAGCGDSGGGGGATATTASPAVTTAVTTPTSVAGDTTTSAASTDSTVAATTPPPVECGGVEAIPADAQLFNSEQGDLDDNDNNGTVDTATVWKDAADENIHVFVTMADGKVSDVALTNAVGAATSEISLEPFYDTGGENPGPSVILAISYFADTTGVANFVQVNESGCVVEWVQEGEGASAEPFTVTINHDGNGLTCDYSNKPPKYDIFIQTEDIKGAHTLTQRQIISERYTVTLGEPIVTPVAAGPADDNIGYGCTQQPQAG